MPAILTEQGKQVREEVTLLLNNLNQFDSFTTLDFPKHLSKVKLTQYLYKLCKKGVITRIGVEETNAVGRPPVVYKKVKRDNV